MSYNDKHEYDLFDWEKGQILPELSFVSKTGKMTHTN